MEPLIVRKIERKIEPLKISPEVLGNFVNVCPTCGIHSFFSRLSLEMHKEVCSKILQQEWFSYSKLTMITNAFRRSGEVLTDKQSEQSAEQSADEFNDDCWVGEQQPQSVFSSMDQSSQMERVQIHDQMMIPSRDNAGQPTGFERLSPVRLSPVRTSPIQSRSPIVRSPVLRSPILGQTLLQSSLLPVSTPGILQSNLLGSPSPQNNPPTVSPDRKNGNYMTSSNRPNRTTNRSVCAICNKKFRNQLQLQFHIKKSHADQTDLRPHRCPVCPARFKVSGTLVTHLRTHTGEKPFPCEECGKTFSQKSALTRHKMIHTGEKPFECSYCHSKFRYKDALQSHELKYHQVARRSAEKNSLPLKFSM